MRSRSRGRELLLSLIRRFFGNILPLAVCGLMTSALGCDRPPQLATIFHGGDRHPHWCCFTRIVGGSLDAVYPNDPLARGRAVRLPQGPDATIPPRGPAEGRAWWPVDPPRTFLQVSRFPTCRGSAYRPEDGRLSGRGRAEGSKDGAQGAGGSWGILPGGDGRD